MPLYILCRWEEASDAWSIAFTTSSAPKFLNDYFVLAETARNSSSKIILTCCIAASGDTADVLSAVASLPRPSQGAVIIGGRADRPSFAAVTHH